MPFLGEIPLDPKVAIGGDAGRPIVAGEDEVGGDRGLPAHRGVDQENPGRLKLKPALLCILAGALILRCWRLDSFSDGLDETVQVYFLQGDWSSGKERAGGGEPRPLRPTGTTRDKVRFAQDHGKSMMPSGCTCLFP